jgi:very-long-chain (3R)-3-hydroxyacyl-CoA dehydratase
MSRLVVVWGVMFVFSAPRATGAERTAAIVGGKQGGGGSLGDWAFVGCLIAWGVTECVRYGFFTLQLWEGRVPRWLVWLRYYLRLTFCRLRPLPPFFFGFAVIPPD